MRMKILLLSALVGFSTAGFAFPTLPNFKMEGQGSVLEVAGFDKGQTILVSIKEVLNSRVDQRIITSMRKAGFAVGTSDTIYFYIPADSCMLRNKLLNCRTSNVKRDDVRVELVDSNNPTVPILQFNGSRYGEDSLSFRFHTVLETQRSLDVHGRARTIEVLKFHSNFWIYQDQQVHGHFGHETTLVNDL